PRLRQGEWIHAPPWSLPRVLSSARCLISRRLESPRQARGAAKSDWLPRMARPTSANPLLRGSRCAGGRRWGATSRRLAAPPGEVRFGISSIEMTRDPDGGRRGPLVRPSGVALEDAFVVSGPLLLGGGGHPARAECARARSMDGRSRPEWGALHPRR